MMEWLQQLEKHSELTPGEWWALVGVCCGLVAFAGLASGLTLGLMSLDAVDMEVLKRSGTEEEKRYAARIIPVIANEHFLLVTLLLCNAAANEALPLFLDRLADPLTAVLLSTTVVLVFGEVLPQALCSRYGLQIGANSAWFVRLLMFLCAPLAWPIGKLLDFLLGGEHTALFRRAQLKALVGLHAEEEGLGGTLSVDEIAIISGALDLTHKTAWTAMTPLDTVFMLPVDRCLDEACLQDILSRGHSRIPVYTAADRSNIVGLILAKELVLVDPAEGLLVGQLPMRTLPRLSASTPLYDMLKLFESGGAHMALLTRPDSSSGGNRALRTSGSLARARSGLIVSGESAYIIEAAGSANGTTSHGEDGWAPPGGWGEVREGDAVGIITIEDVIEELLGAEIVDETDLFVDNLCTSRVDAGELSKQLPARLRKVLARGEFTPRVGRLGVQRLGASSGGGAGPAAAAAAAAAVVADGGHVVVHAPHHQQPPRRHHHQPPHFTYYQQPSLPGASSPGPSSWQQSASLQQHVAGDSTGSSFEGGMLLQGGADADHADMAAMLAGGDPSRAPSEPLAIRPSRSSSGGAPGGGGGTPNAGGSWAAGANAGARRVRFGTDSLHATLVLKPRLLDPDDED